VYLRNYGHTPPSLPFGGRSMKKERRKVGKCEIKREE
jgi:hypothetical protein